MLTSKGVSEDCLEFLNVDQDVAINLVPFENMRFIPRIGGRVLLPGTSEGEKMYEVRGVEYI
jgi:hypothetical protein